MPDDTAVHTETGEEKYEQQPDADVDGLCTVEELFTVLYTKKCFSGHDRSIHPALCAHPLAVRISRVHVVLPGKPGEVNKTHTSTFLPGNST